MCFLEPNEDSVCYFKITTHARNDSANCPEIYKSWQNLFKCKWFVFCKKKSKNQIYVIRVVVPVRCNDLTYLFVATWSSHTVLSALLVSRLQFLLNWPIWDSNPVFRVNKSEHQPFHHLYCIFALQLLIYEFVYDFESSRTGLLLVCYVFLLNRYRSYALAVLHFIRTNRRRILPSTQLAGCKTNRRVCQYIAVVYYVKFF